MNNDDVSIDYAIHLIPEITKELCIDCGQNSCDWLKLESEICEECEQLVDERCTNKEVHYHAYHLYTRLINGVLQNL
jgi:hypothetical protein